MPMFATCKLSAVNSQPSSVRISHGNENFDFRCRVTPIIITSMSMSAKYRAQVEHSILFMIQIVNQYFERQFFSVAPLL